MKTKKKKSKVLRVILLILIIILFIIVTAAGTAFWYISNKLGKINYVDIDEENLQISAIAKNNLEGYRNIALFGIDTRADSYATSRTDCIIIVSINEKTKEVKLISVYRDAYLDITDRGLDKVTHAYVYGGAEKTISTLNRNLDLNITEFVTVNFEAAKKIVDAVGGIKMTVTDAEATQITGIGKAGTYNLTGSQALEYARTRNIDSDYKRTERMRDVLTAVFNKAKTMNVTQLNNLADEILPLVYTNIKTSEIFALAPDAISYKISESNGWPYEVKGATISNIWYGVPVTLEENVKKLHQDVFNQDEYEPSEIVKEISNSIVKKTGYK